MPRNLADLTVAALAAKRITRLIVDDAILDEVRNKIWDRFPPEESKIGYVITCHSCSSVWAAAAVTSGLVPNKLITLLALSEAALQINAVEEKLSAD